MALEWQKVWVPASGGLKQSVDADVTPFQAPIQCTNGTIDKEGRIRKRNGFTSDVVVPLEPGEEVRACFSTGESVCALGQHWLYSHSSQLLNFAKRGPVSPFCGSQTDVFRGNGSWARSDMATANGLTIYAATRGNTVTGAADAFALDYIIKDGDGITVAGPLNLNESTRTLCSSIRASSSYPEPERLILATIPDGSTTLELYDIDHSDPTAAPGALTTLPSRYSDDAAGYRSFDVVPHPTGGCIVASIDVTTQRLEMQHFRPDGVTSVTTDTITDYNFRAVTLATDTDNGYLYAFVWADGDPTTTLLLYCRTLRDLSSDPWTGPITVRTVPADTVIPSIGVAYGDGAISCTWGERYIPAGSPSYCETRARTATAAKGLFTNSMVLPNSCPVTQPFYENGHHYLVCQTAMSTDVSHVGGTVYDIGGNAPDLAPFDTTFVVDLTAETSTVATSDDHWLTTDQKPGYLVGVLNVGVAPISSGAVVFGNTDNAERAGMASCGTANHIVRTGALAEFMAHSMTYQLGVNTAQAATAVSLDFAAVPTTVSDGAGYAVIGGGMVHLFDGSLVTEAGFLAPPMWEDSVTENGGLGPTYFLTGEVVQYIAHANYSDARGRVHRSIPGLPMEHTVVANESSLSVRMRNLPLSNRSFARGFVYDVYASSDASIYRRHTFGANSNYAWSTSTYSGVFLDSKSVPIEGENLYTTGGEIEAVCPEGARVVSLINGRPWLGDLYARARVQYGKPIAPGTATEDAYAPEFNEGFGYVLSRDARVTGLAELDEKAIVFTDAGVLVVSGEGPDNAGLNNDFSGLLRLQSDTGCKDPRSVVSFRDGVLFQGERGLYLLDRSLAVIFVGYDVVDETDAYPEITSATLVPGAGHIRFTCLNAARDAGIVLIFDYEHQRWFKWQLTDGFGEQLAPVGGCLHQGVYHVIEADGRLWREDASTYYDATSQWVPLTFETAPVQIGGQSAYQRCQRIVAKMTQEDPCSLTATLLTGLPQDTTETLTIEAEQTGIKPKAQKAQAHAIRITDAATTSSDSGAGYSLSGILFKIGVKSGTVKLPDTQVS